jgi:probable F420-dependent oxidoreductase
MAIVRQFGIYLPNVGWGGLPTPSELAGFAVAAEESGFDSVWVEDRLLHAQLGILDALSTLTYVAARTQRVRLGTSVLLINLRNPLVLAKAIATLDYLSSGRVTIGASLGGRPDEYPAAGVVQERRVTRYVETVKAMRAYWGQGPVEGVAKQFRLENVEMAPRPVQERIPILVGGRAPAALERAATLGDGWLASSTTTPEGFATGWATVLGHAAAQGRDPSALTPAKFVYVHLDDDEGRAQAVLAERLPRYYDFPYDVRLTLHGSPGRVVDGARALLDAGVGTLIFATVAGDRAQLDRLAKDVLPALRDA